MHEDPLSDILRLTEAKSVIAGGIAASGKWAIAFPAPGEIKFSVLAKGSCVMRLDGQRNVIRGAEGDVMLLPGGRGFVAGSSLDVAPEDGVAFMKRRTSVIAKIGAGTETLVLAGGVALNPANASLLRDALPPFIHVKGDAPAARAMRWVVQQLVEEQTEGAPGTGVAAAMLAQLLFVHVLRAWLATAPALPAGWLRVVRDERLAPALRLMHGDPARDWKLEELARAAAMSRTTFAVRFKEAAGLAPLQYLTEWRMRLAQRRLRDDHTPVAQIASSLGYASESAFSQAFKRLTGLPPREYRNSA